MTAKPRRKTPSAPKGRNKTAQGNALDHAATESQSPKGATDDSPGQRPGSDAPQPLSPEGAEQSGNLPKGWRMLTVGEMTETMQYGSSAKTSEDESGVPVLRMGNIKEGALVLDSLKYLPRNHPEFPDLLLRDGDLLFNRTNSAELVGKSAVYRGNPETCSCASYLIRVQLKPEFVPEYVANYLNSPIGRQWIASVVSQQVGQANVNGSKLKALSVPVPGFDGQRRIVAEIEKQFTRLEAGVAALRRVQVNLKRYRAAVLKAACEGRLFTAIESASESEEGYGPPKALPEGWHWTTASEICEAVVDCHNKTAPYTESGIPLVRTTNIRGGKINLENTRFVDQPTYEFWSRRCTPNPGDVIFTREAPMGEAGIIPDGVTLCMGQRMMLLRASPKILNRYLLTALLTPGLLNHITKTAVGSGVQHLRVRDVESLPIPLPPLAEQTRIVAEVERRLSVVEELEAVVTTNLQRATRLRQSILQKAFTGGMSSQ